MNKNFRKIILCGNDVTQIGGVSRVIHCLAQGFVDLGYEVELLGMNQVDASISFSGESDKSADYPVSIAYMGQPPVRAENPEKWARMRGEAVGYLRRFVEEQDKETTLFIVFQVYVMEHLLETGLDFNAMTGYQVIGAYHSSYQGARITKDVVRVKKAYANITRFLTLTEADRDAFAREGMTNGSFVYNPVELLSTPPSLPWEQRQRRVVFVGRLVKGKNVVRLVEAWAQVAQEFPDWRFEIYGSGDEEKLIAEAILANNLMSSVALMGMTQEPEAVFADSRLMLMDSEYEGLPVSIVEAGLTGTPTLSSDNFPGAHVLIEDGVSGAIVGYGNNAAFVEKLRILLRDQDLLEQLGHGSQKHMERFSVDSIMKDWEFLLESLNF